MRGGEEKGFFFSLVVFFGGGLHHHHQSVRVPVCYLLFIYLLLQPRAKSIGQIFYYYGTTGLLGRLYSNQFELEIQPPRVTREEEEERKRKNAD
jgi:hypothetical protein